MRPASSLHLEHGTAEPVLFTHPDASSTPSLTLDPDSEVHQLEPGKSKSDEARLQEHWDQSIAKHMDLPEGYSDVHVLIIKWNDEIERPEVRENCDDLKELFINTFNYKVQEIELMYNEWTNQSLLETQVDAWAQRCDRADNLLIVYYLGDTSYDLINKALQLVPPYPPAELDDSTKVIWEFVEKPLLERVRADVLLLFDCCFASNPHRDNRETKFTERTSETEPASQASQSIRSTGRKFEMIIAPPIGHVTNPGDPSLTKYLIKHLRQLTVEFSASFFTTSDLHKRIQDDCPTQSLTLWARLSRSRGQGHIRLCPLEDRTMVQGPIQHKHFSMPTTSEQSIRQFDSDFVEGCANVLERKQDNYSNGLVNFEGRFAGDTEDTHPSPTMSLFSDTESIFSFVSDSTTPSTTNSRESEEVLISASEQLVILLVNDNVLHQLFLNSITTKGLGAERSFRNFRRLIKIFAKELRAEAQLPIQKVAAQFVETRATYVTQSIRTRYDVQYENLHIYNVKSDQEEREFKKKRLENYLREQKDISSHDNEQHPQPDDGDLSSEEEGNDSQELGELTNFEQVKHFITNSNAYSKLRKDFERFVESSRTKAAKAKEVPETSDVFGELEPATPQDKRLSESVEQSKMTPTISQLSHAPTAISREHTLWRNLIQALKRLARPSVREGYRRLEWTCDCGKEMYGDYDDRNTVALNKLAFTLQQRSYSSGSIEGSRNQETGVSMSTTFHEATSRNGQYSAGGGGIGAASQANPSQSPTQSGSPTPMRSSDQSTVPENVTENSPSIINNNTPGISGPETTTLVEKQFFELCVNTGGFEINLGEIDITDVKSDGELFERINSKYREIRGHRMRRIFVKPVDVHFVRISVQRRYRVGIYGVPHSIPPEEEVKAKQYLYEECPLEVQPPMDFRTFLHYMDTPGHGDDFFFKRLPKKVGSSLADQRSATTFGWGVHIIEGPNKVVLSWTTFICLVLSLIVSALYCYLWQTQEQGFGIGQWMVAVLTAAMAALYFQWAET